MYHIDQHHLVILPIFVTNEIPHLDGLRQLHQAARPRCVKQKTVGEKPLRTSEICFKNKDITWVGPPVPRIPVPTSYYYV